LCIGLKSLVSLVDLEISIRAREFSADIGELIINTVSGLDSLLSFRVHGVEVARASNCREMIKWTTQQKAEALLGVQ